MKKLVVIAAVVVSAVLSAHAQGRITFASAGAGVAAQFRGSLQDPVYSNAPLTSAMSQFRADLWWAPGTTTVGVADTDLVNQGGYAQSFSSVAAQAGYFTGGTKTVTGWSAGMIVAQVRVWDTSFGTFDNARAQLGGSWFLSPIFTITPTLSPTPAPNLVGLGNPATFNLNYNIPEPATFALAGLGGAALLILRRRRS